PPRGVVRLPRGAGGTEARVGPGSLDTLPDRVRGQRTVLIADRRVLALHGELVRARLGTGLAGTAALPAGEPAKRPGRPCGAWGGGSWGGGRVARSGSCRGGEAPRSTSRASPPRPGCAASTGRRSRARSSPRPTPAWAARPRSTSTGARTWSVPSTRPASPCA